MALNTGHVGDHWLRHVHPDRDEHLELPVTRAERSRNDMPYVDANSSRFVSGFNRSTATPSQRKNLAASWLISWATERGSDAPMIFSDREYSMVSSL